MKADVYETSVDNQVSIAVLVYQGEFGETKENIFLDDFTLYGVPPAPAGKEKVKVCFSIDANGILDVSAELLSTGNKRSIVIAGSGNVSKDDIEKMLKRFSDTSLQKDIQSWSFKVIEGSSDKPMIVLEHRGANKEFSPEENILHDSKELESSC
ncbi:hypothetical protein L1987_52673 [Smallanthus sonchifolius]|uniref:Uncharacterized protein n=1 Tax=Smallanthus sonchifolius TaxID=185202 RepID=A0ACB9ET54_9ASTR|nr:hypothetical protein L1987_52673 [Smallanthus sonchifolius]